MYKIGPAEDLTYDYKHMGNTHKVINDILENKSELNKVLKEGKNNHIIISGNLADELEHFN